MLRHAMVILIAGMTTAHAAPCTPIHFASGTSSAVVAGIAPANTTGAESICYTLAVRPGQTVDVTVTGQNVGMTIPDVGDMRDHFRFVATRRVYMLAVGQVGLAPMNKPPFSFAVSVN